MGSKLALLLCTRRLLHYLQATTIAPQSTTTLFYHGMLFIMFRKGKGRGRIVRIDEQRNGNGNQEVFVGEPIHDGPDH